jgi:hypothetical protein
MGLRVRLHLNEKTSPKIRKNCPTDTSRGEFREHFLQGCCRYPNTAKSMRSSGVPGCHLDTPAILQESPSFLVLIDIDIAVRVYPDGMAAINLAGPCRTHPPGDDLPIDREEGD